MHHKIRHVDTIIRGRDLGQQTQETQTVPQMCPHPRNTTSVCRDTTYNARFTLFTPRLPIYTHPYPLLLTLAVPSRHVLLYCVYRSKTLTTSRKLWSYPEVHQKHVRHAFRCKYYVWYRTLHTVHYRSPPSVRQSKGATHPISPFFCLFRCRCRYRGAIGGSLRAPPSERSRRARVPCSSS